MVRVVEPVICWAFCMSSGTLPVLRIMNGAKRTPSAWSRRPRSSSTPSFGCSSRYSEPGAAP
jgi:hypothetical protein